MPSCREVDSLFTPYVDGEATAAERAIVEAHLRACPKCRHQTALQAAARESVRAKLCPPCAPEQLRARCRAAARTRTFGIPRALASLSMAAALALLVGGVLLYTLTGLSPSVLAAQLTLDHISCFAFRGSNEAVDPRASEDSYVRDYGQQVRLPRANVGGLQLVGMRRCYCGEGAAAHAMYRLNGRPVSLYVIPDASRSRASTDVLGHDAIMWSKEGTTYVLVSRAPRETLEQLATAFDSW
ncbi:MAG TPA: zf-HC2 domain-containing protein [Vicinamibacterales bacterium]|nr:zf-HC2 domain-containing protein [Vicinamibacterales bacterium]